MPQRHESAVLKTYPVLTGQAELRLDAFLGRMLPGLGTRGGKRLIEQGLVLVNGTPRLALHRLREGDLVAVAQAAPGPEEYNELERGVRLVAWTDSFAALYKPPGLHTAALPGKPGPSLEAALPRIWPALCAQGPEPSAPHALPPLLAEALRLMPVPEGERPSPAPLPAAPPLLLSRLDRETSGLVAAAFSPEAAADFREMEASGLACKHYLTVVRGELAGPVLCAAALDTASRRRTRVLDKDAEDGTRHTLVTPVGDASALLPQLAPPLTLAVARIQRGARHQIRAHLAALGTPIAGDGLYGNDAPGSPLYLHHACLTLPGFAACCPPPFFLP